MRNDIARGASLTFGVCVALFFMLALGFAMGKDGAATDCKRFGKFYNNGAVYECRPVAQSD